MYRKQITHLQDGNQTDMELRNRTVGLRQQVQHSHHAQIPIQNSQSPRKCNLVCNKSYCTQRFQHPLRDVIHGRINKHHNNLQAHPNPLLQPLLQPINTRRLKCTGLQTDSVPEVTSLDEYTTASQRYTVLWRTLYNHHIRLQICSF